MDDQDDPIRRAQRLCFFAHYHPQGIAAEHVLIYLRALAAAGFTVVVLSTATMPEEEQRRLRAACALLIVRDNVGFDFGGWIEAIRRFFPIEAELLLFANDSVYAPVGDLAGFLDRLTATPADFYGVIESLEITPHLQSWFLLFRPSAYTSPAFLGLLGRPIPSTMSKTEIIARYEVGLTGTLTAAGLSFHAAYRPARDGVISAARHFNAGHLLWRLLITKARVPFLKIELLRDNPMRVTDVAAWRGVVGKRAPALRDAIADDLARRRASSGVGTPHPWRTTLDQPNPAFWPELQHFLRRDYHLGRKRLWHWLNDAIYRRLRDRADRVRGKARLRGWQLPPLIAAPASSAATPPAASPDSVSPE